MTLPDLKLTPEPKQEKPFAWIFEMAETDPVGLAVMAMPFGKFVRDLAYNAIQEAHPDFFQSEQPAVPVEKI